MPKLVGLGWKIAAEALGWPGSFSGACCTEVQPEALRVFNVASHRFLMAERTFMPRTNICAAAGPSAWPIPALRLSGPPGQLSCEPKLRSDASSDIALLEGRKQRTSKAEDEITASRGRRRRVSSCR